MFQVHEIKTDPAVFRQSWDGNKPYEIRLDDRHYKIGDELLLRETTYSGFEISNGSPLEFTGRALRVLVLSKLSDVYGLRPGWCCMGVREITRYNTLQRETL